MFLGTYPMIFVDFYIPKYLFKYVIKIYNFSVKESQKTLQKMKIQNEN